MEKQLAELVNRLSLAAGANLKSVVLYGSAASGEFQAQHSDLNVLAVLDRVGAPELARINPVARWWESKGHPTPLVFTAEELRHSADVFAIEFLDIQANRRVLLGEDYFALLDVPLGLHRAQVERELRTNVIRLRQHFLVGRRNSKELLRLMTESISSFTALFRHALVALGEQPPKSKREVVERLAEIAGFEAHAIETVLDVREGKRRGRDINVEQTFADYLSAVTHVAHEVDRRFGR